MLYTLSKHVTNECVRNFCVESLCKVWHNCVGKLSMGFTVASFERLLLFTKHCYCLQRWTFFLLLYNWDNSPLCSLIIIYECGLDKWIKMNNENVSLSQRKSKLHSNRQSLHRSNHTFLVCIIVNKVSKWNDTKLKDCHVVDSSCCNRSFIVTTGSPPCSTIIFSKTKLYSQFAGNGIQYYQLLPNILL